METLWKVLCLVVLGPISAQLCNGLPIVLTTTGPDPNTQYLTGLAVLLAICSVVLLAGCICCRRNKNGFAEFRDSPVVASVASNLDHGHVNPIANSEFTIFTPISPSHHNNNVFLANQRIVNRTQEDFKYGDIDVSSWFDGSEKDFPRTRLKYIRELGKGWFGRVVEGTAQGLSQDPGEPEWTPVVVRILDASASSKERVLFLHDADVYRHGYHPHILMLSGRCLDTNPLLLLQEYCTEGDLKKYLRSARRAKEKFLSSDLPLLWCCQLTQALKFLHEQKVAHPDLAARNCQLTKELTLKLGDYGLNSSFYPEDYYQGSLAVPLRWCAPEIISYTNTTIQTKKVTLEGNIWSLGVTMWEILECGNQPYSDLTDDDVISQVLGPANVRLPRPVYNVIYTDYMYKLMQSCWSTAELRPAATHIDLILTDLMQVYEHTKVSTDQTEPTSLQDFDQRWETLKPNSLITDETPLIQEDKKSESLTNLHGSLDNLLEDQNPMDSWLQNVADNTGDLIYAKGLSQAMMDLDNVLDLSSDSNRPSPKPLRFKIGAKVATSSESETEDENWKKKIECGAYTEKVRQKSQSVADLMILTHVDYSESDSETLPSLTEYKNQKPKYKENPALKFGSEGNLLSVHDTFQEELRKLQDERRDSLLFVPDKYSYTDSKSAESSSSRQLDSLENSPVKKLIVELNSPSEMIPPKQVYNVFNVSVRHLNSTGGGIDNKDDRAGLQRKTSCDSLKESKDNKDVIHIKNNEKAVISCDKTKGEDLFEYHTKMPSSLKSLENLNDFHVKIEILSDQSSPIDEEIASLDRPGSSDDYIKETKKLHVPKLSEIIQRNVTFKPCGEDKLLLTKFADKDLIDKDSGLNTPENSASLEKLYDDMEEILDEPPVLKKCSKCAISFEENGSFDSDIKVDLHKDLCLLKEEMKISSSDGSGCEEDSGTGTSSKGTQSIDDNLSAKSLEDALDTINNDYCLRRSKIICESFLANEKSNYSPTDEYREICFISNSKSNGISDDCFRENSTKDVVHQIMSAHLIPDLLTGLPDVDKTYSKTIIKGDKIESLRDYLLKPLIHIETFQPKTNISSDTAETNPNNLNLTKTSLVLPIIKSSPNDKGSDDSISSSKSDSVESVAEFLSPEISDFKTISERSVDGSQNNPSEALAIDSSAPNTMLDVSSEEMKTLEDADSVKTLGGDSDSDLNNIEEYAECVKRRDWDDRSNAVDSNLEVVPHQSTQARRRDSLDILRKTKEFLCQELVFYDCEKVGSKEAYDSDILFEDVCDKHFKFVQNSVGLSDVNTTITSLSRIIHINKDVNVENVSKAISPEISNEPDKETDCNKRTDQSKNTLNHVQVPHKGLSELDLPIVQTKSENLSTGSGVFVTREPDVLVDIKPTSESVGERTQSESYAINEVESITKEGSLVKELLAEVPPENEDPFHLVNEDDSQSITEEVEKPLDEVSPENKDLLSGQETIVIKPKDIDLALEKAEALNESDVHFSVKEEIESKINILSNQPTKKEEGCHKLDADCTVDHPEIPSMVISEESKSTTVEEIKSAQPFLDLIETQDLFTNEAQRNKNFGDHVDDKNELTDKQFQLTPKLELLKSDPGPKRFKTEEMKSTSPIKIDAEAEYLLDQVSNTDSNLEELQSKTNDLFIKEPNFDADKKKDAKPYGVPSRDSSSLTHCCEPLIASTDKEIRKEHDEEVTNLNKEEKPDIFEEPKIIDRKKGINSENIKVEISPAEHPIAENHVVLATMKSESPVINETVIENENLALLIVSSDEEIRKEPEELANSNRERNPDIFRTPKVVEKSIDANQETNLKNIKEEISPTEHLIVENEAVSVRIKPDSLVTDKTVIANENLETPTKDKIEETIETQPNLDFTKDYDQSGSVVLTKTGKAPEIIGEKFEFEDHKLFLTRETKEAHHTERENCNNIVTDAELGFPLSTVCDNELKASLLMEEKRQTGQLDVNAEASESTDIKIKSDRLENTISEVNCEDQMPPQPGSGSENVTETYENPIGTEDNLNKMGDDLLKDGNFSSEGDQNMSDSVVPTKELSKVSHSFTPDDKSKEIKVVELEDILIDLTNDEGECVGGRTEAKPKELFRHEITSLLDTPIDEEKLDASYNETKIAINKIRDFFRNEIDSYADKPKQELLVQFDLSDSQEEIAPNSLTHFQGYTSTPFAKKRALESSVILGASDDYSIDFYSGLKTAVDPVEAEELKFSSNFMQEPPREPNNDLYSLETWDNFLGKSFDEQENNLDFVSFNQEPHSLLFLESDNAEFDTAKLKKANNLQVSHVVNETYVPESKSGEETSRNVVLDKTYDAGKRQEGDATFTKDVSINETMTLEEGKPSTSTGWESGGGWFLHPQSNSEELSGQIAVQESTADSYVGFSMDDEIMAAIRNELLNKLPHAQRASSEQVEEREELEPAEKNEVFIRYNVYNTPLSPIPEESYIGSDDESLPCTPKRVSEESDDDSSDWSIEDNVSFNIRAEMNSPKPGGSMVSSPAKVPYHRHTPSQDSCCSNDTLFNIEDLNVALEHDRIFETIPDEDESSRYSDCNAEIAEVEDKTLVDEVEEEIPKISVHNYITDFLDNERYNQLNSCVELGDLRSEYEECSSTSDKYLTVSDNTLSFGQNVAPLNSPEDRQWKDLQASFRTCEETEHDRPLQLNETYLTPIGNYDEDLRGVSRKFELVTDLDDPDLDDLEDCPISDEDIDKVLREDDELIPKNEEEPSSSNTQLIDNISPNLDNEAISSAQEEDNRLYINTLPGPQENGVATIGEAAEYDGAAKNGDSPEYVYVEKPGDSHEYENGWIADTIYANMPADRAKELDYVIAEESKKAEENIEDLYGPLADIRFSGPGLANLQIMSTSFSESNEVGDEQDWDSGSDTRSSSSGEFIWREGEHEASLKALDAAPQSENAQDAAPMEEIQEENESSSGDSDAEGECPEFVPSAWDKYAIPAKSALRSPEKTLERKDPKDKKVVWFKKQKYHCIYEYPKEPDSPPLQSYDLWKPTPDYATLADWELGPDMYVPTFDLIEPLTSVTDQTKNLYHLTAFPEKGPTVLDEDFYVSSSSKPFDMLGGQTSQFFPGRQFSDHWNDVGTPDGDEALPPPPPRPNNRIPTLKHLATIAASRGRRSGELGGLRHTRSKLKLDLPPSPSAFSGGTTFAVGEPAEEIAPRQAPTFSTFGKSRFLVQHVDTPPDDRSAHKNVSFEALPYKPQRAQAIESVRGEASLLDSADEDSGIDSSTLERGRKVET